MRTLLLTTGLLLAACGAETGVATFEDVGADTILVTVGATPYGADVASVGPIRTSIHESGQTTARIRYTLTGANIIVTTGTVHPGLSGGVVPEISLSAISPP